MSLNADEHEDLQHILASHPVSILHMRSPESDYQSKPDSKSVNNLSHRSLLGVYTALYFMFAAMKSMKN